MSSQLFSPFQLRELTLANRIVYSPMGMDAAEYGGTATDFHMIHLGSMALSGAGLIFTEATAICAQGMGTPHTLGLYTDEHEVALKRVIDAAKRYSTAKHALQLWHAGRKASTKRPEPGQRHTEFPVSEGGWDLIGPSAIPYPRRTNPLRAMEEPDFEEVKQHYINAAKRAARVGYDLLEVHLGHGYLLHSFLSPLSNQRSDRFGGDIENRMRYPLEVIRAVREVWPQERPLGARVSGTDWHDEGWSIENAVIFARAAKEAGCDYLTASSGGSTTEQKITVAPGYQVKLAERIRREADIPTIAVGIIWEPQFAEFVIAQGHADLVALGRGMVADPRWPWRAADLLGGEVQVPTQYSKCVPRFMRENLFRKVSGT